VTLNGDTAAVLKDRCIGCGVCVPSCSEEAIRLQAKPEEERQAPPAHFMETYRRIAKERVSIKRSQK
jgi:Na+-translocating ferredoxin:NAD+ oxidoreductase subunit B